MPPLEQWGTFPGGAGLPKLLQEHIDDSSRRSLKTREQHLRNCRPHLPKLKNEEEEEEEEEEALHFEETHNRFKKYICATITTLKLPPYCCHENTGDNVGQGSRRQTARRGGEEERRRGGEEETDGVGTEESTDLFGGKLYD
ncbi:unnamed protein product [Pleuronectes platessa]|uniref:Uncharacterized protein n=1 Tax=Pleuronectes platessa TaxID=8262 RepID=A0A9N7VR95_PLEPL|nr:unnamed protein product [Pleuronectes platessa]